MLHDPLLLSRPCPDLLTEWAGPALPDAAGSPSAPPPGAPQPTDYQAAAVRRALASLERHRGAMIVASTGLGKTVVASEIARRLDVAGSLGSLIVCGPKPVGPEWQAHLAAVGLRANYVNLPTLDAPAAGSRAARRLERWLQALGPEGLIVIDESHTLRNRYTRGGRERRAFRRLLPAVAGSGCRVLLLTATPFATTPDDVNQQLLLLPNTGPSRALLEAHVPHPRAWHVHRLEALPALPVVTMLTTPEVARTYARTDGHHTYVEYGAKRRYLPRVRLDRRSVPLVAAEGVSCALRAGAFAAEPAGDSAPDGIERLVRVAAASSPWALREIVVRTCATPGPDGFERARFRLSRTRRRALLAPLIEQLADDDLERDGKLAALLDVLDDRCTGGGKAVVFAERHATAAYLEYALGCLRPALKTACTVRRLGPDRYAAKPAERVRRLILDFAPRANGHTCRFAREYDVLLTTDAFGAGINLQDAGTVVSYDLAWTPVRTAQRAGRILRPWPRPREVTVIAFVPQLATPADPGLVAPLAALASRWATLCRRHDHTTMLLDLPSLPTGAPAEQFAMHELAAGNGSDAVPAVPGPPER